MAKIYLAFYRQGLLLSRKWNVFKAIDWEIQFQPFFLYALVHQELIKLIEFEEKWSCISSAYLKKEKEVSFKKKKNLCTACSLKHWVYKETKVYVTACLTLGHIKELKHVI